MVGRSGRGGRGSLAIMALAALLGAATAPGAALGEAAAQGIDILRSSGRAAERAIREQVGRALRPTLTVRNGYDDPPRGIAVSSDATHLAVVTGDGGLRIFDLVDGRQALSSRAAGLSRVAAGAAGRPVLSLDRDGRVLAAPGWADAPGRPLRLSTGGEATAIAVAGRMAVAGGADGSVTVWDARTLAPLGAAPATGEAVTAIGVGSEGDIAVAGDEDGGLRVIAADGTARAVSGAEADTVTAVAQILGTLFAAGDEDGRLVLLDAGPAEALVTIEAHDDPVTAIAGLANGFATASEDGSVRVWDSRARLQREIELDWEGPVTGLAALRVGGQERLVVAGPDRALHLFDAGGRERLARLVLTRTGWGAVDARGRFDGDPSALQDVAWQAGALRLPVENLAARYFEPGLWVKHLAARAFLTRAPDAVEQGIYPPPVVDIDVEDEADAPGQPIVLEIEAEARQASDIAELRLFHNGKRVPDTALRETDRGRRSVTWEATVTAVPGENSLVAVARGWGEIDSVPVEARVELGRGGAGALAVTAIGIDRYAGAELRLNYAAADASAIADELARRGRQSFAATGTDLVLDDRATRAGLDAALARLRETAPGDVAVLFLAGHARMVRGEWYFLPRELTDLRDDGQVMRLGLSGAALAAALTGIPAQRLLLVIDACQAGGILGSFEEYGQRRALQQLKTETGVAVIAATRADQLAKEYAALGHGLLTYVFLEGMRPGGGGRLAADRAPADGALTAAEMKAYVEERAPALAAELDARIPAASGPRGEFSQRVPVTPVGVVLGGDFPIAR